MKLKRNILIGFVLFLVFLLAGVVVTHAHAATQNRSNTTLTSASGDDFDLFGISVDILPSGGIALVGASQGTSSANSGSSYYFPSVSSLTNGLELGAGSPSPGDDFGHSVAISDDGTTLVIGSPDADVINDSPNTSAFHGAVYIFTQSGISWSQKQRIIAPTPTNEGQFGYSVDVSDNGSTIIVGTNAANEGVFIYEKSGLSWRLQKKLTPNSAAGDAQFGASVALSGDGDTALVGADMLTVNGNNDQGAAFIFARGGTAWVQQAKLNAADGAQFDYFGSAVDLSDDGNTALVGANFKGAAYIFARNGTLWSQRDKLTPSDGSGGDRFGQSVALTNSGSIAVVGAQFSRSAYLFMADGNSWTQLEKLQPANDASGDEFGSAVALADNGNTILVGAPGTDVGTSTSQGAVYIFRSVVPLSATNLLLLK